MQEWEIGSRMGEIGSGMGEVGRGRGEFRKDRSSDPASISQLWASGLTN